MEEHKLLTGMLLAALVVSIGGTLIAVDTMNSPTQVASVTGAATGTGTGSATVSADISIDVSDSAISLGAGTVDPGTDFAIVYSTPDNDTEGGSWGNNTDDNLTIENIGNTRINLTVQSSNSSGNGSRGFACQGETCATEFGNPEGVALKLLLEELGSSCDGNGVSIGTNRNVIDFAAADTEYVACECLNYAEGSSEILAFMQAGIPDDAPAGSPSTTFTFTSYEPDAGFC